MLKILSSYENYETYLINEMQISKWKIFIFLLEQSLLDFIVESNPDTIYSSLSNLFKSDKPNDKLYYDKLIYIFSLISNKINDKEEKCFENIIEVTKKMKDIPEEKKYSDLFYITNNQKLKKIILNKVKLINNKESLKGIINMFLNYLNKENDEEVLNSLLDYIVNNKAFILISKKKKQNLKNLLKDIKTENGAKVLFYLTFSYDNIIYSNISDLKEKVKNLTNENEILSSIHDSKKIFDFDYSKLEENYGNECTEIIESFIKQYVIHYILLNKFLDKKYVSFDDFEKEIGYKIEDIEDSLIEGNDSGIFKVRICYNDNKIKIIFIKRSSFNKNDIDKLSEEILTIKNKIDLTYNAIEQI